MLCVTTSSLHLGWLIQWNLLCTNIGGGGLSHLYTILQCTYWKKANVDYLISRMRQKIKFSIRIEGIVPRISYNTEDDCNSQIWHLLKLQSVKWPHKTISPRSLNPVVCLAAITRVFFSAYILIPNYLIHTKFHTHVQFTELLIYEHKWKWMIYGFGATSDKSNCGIVRLCKCGLYMQICGKWDLI